MPTLSEKLKSLGVKIGARDLPAPPPRRAYPIEKVIPGRVQPTEYGEAFVVETDYSLDYRHGQMALALTSPLSTIADWARDARIAQGAAEHLLFLDVETTGLAGGTGTLAFVIGIGRLQSMGFRVTQIFVRDPAEEPAALAALSGLLAAPDVLVTFNGKAFDVPLLNARYITNRFATPFASPPHLDLLLLARRLWRERLESRALGSLETHILKMARSQEDVPGWLIPQMYFDYLHSGDARPLARVLYHNAMDIVAMAALLNHVAQMLADPIGFATDHGLDWIALGKLFEDLDRLEDAAALYARGLSLDLPEETFRQTVQRLAFVQRRRGEMAAALDLWREAAGTRQIYAFVEIAKYYEHRARDYALAAQWTRDALTVLATRDAHERQQWQADLEHRLKRLEKRVQGP